MKTLNLKMATASVFALFLTLGACNVAQPDRSDESEVVAQEEPQTEHDDGAEPRATSLPSEPASAAGHFGAPFVDQGDAMPLSQALEQCSDTGTSCKVTGTIDAVCQRRGCWFTLAAADVQSMVRIRMVDYGFFVPANAMGHDVIFEGTLTREQISQEQAQHYADDQAASSGEAPHVVEGPEDTFQFMITGAEILPRP